MSGKILEAKLVITGSDATGPAFKEIESKISKLANTANTVSRVSSAISGVGMKVNEAALGVDKIARGFGTISLEVSRAERQIGSFGKALHGLGGIAKGLGGVIATSLSFGAVTDLGKGIKAAANYAAELAHLKYAANLSPKELSFAEKAATELPAKYSNQSAAEILKSYGELRAAVTHPSEVPKLFEPAIALKSALETEGKEVSPEDFRASVKALEIAGYSDSPERFSAFAEGLVKGRQVEGSLMTPENVLEFVRNAGSAARAFSPRFIRDVMPSLIGEQGGQKSGAAMSQIYKTNLGTGLAHAPDAVAQLLELGLIRKDDIAYNKQGNPSGLKPGRQLKDAALAISDPDLWMQKDLMPAMDRLHYTDIQKKAAFARIYKGKTGPSEVEMMDTQAELFKQHAANIEGAGGVEAAAKVRAADPMKAMEDVATALGNAVTALTGDSMKQFAAAAEKFANAVNSIVPNLKAFAGDHPLVSNATVAGGAAAGGWLGWKGLQRVAPGIFGGGNATAAGAAGGGLLRRAIPGALMLEGAGIGASSAWQNPGHVLGGSGWDAAKRLWGSEDRSARTIPGALTPLSSSSFSPGPVTAKLDGQASINVALSIDAPPELLALMRSGVSTTAIGDLRPDTGVSMPESTPSQGGRNGVSR